MLARAMFFKRFAVLVICLAAGSVANAKGIFQAEGKITELQKNGDVITFRFIGTISFGYATAPDRNPKRKWRDIGWDATDISVKIGDWTRPYKSTERDAHPDAQSIYKTLSDLAKTDRSIQFSLDNPTFTFSNTGQLLKVSGTYIYPREHRR